MSKISLLSIILILIVLNALIFWLCQINVQDNGKRKTEKYQCLKEKEKIENQLIQYDKFSKAMADVGKIPYNRESNNCYDHSKKLVELFESYDIASSIMINENRTHAWVAAWIDAVDGEFIKPDNPFRILEVRDDKLKVVCDSYQSVKGKDVIK